MKIVIAGSGGFIGTHLAAFFQKMGQEVILLSRNPKEPNAHFWDPESNQIDPFILEGSDVVINLCGESILGRWNQEKMEKIRDSRLKSTQFLCNTLLSVNALPKLYIGASAIGYYGDRKNELLVESSSSGHGFLAEVCREWEKIPEVLGEKNIRVVLCRFGMVFGENGGALKQMEKAFSMGMGGVLGSGEQIMSWIAIDDVSSAILFVIENPAIAGAVNFTSPNPVSNHDFTKIFGKLLRRPTLVPIPKFALSIMFGQGAEVFLASEDVRPGILLANGYTFQYPEIEEALKKYLPIKV